MLAHSQNHLDKRIYQELKFCEFGYCQQLTKRYLRRWKYRRNRHFRPLQSKNISQAVHFFSSSTHYPPNKSGPVPSLRQKTCNLKISKLNSVSSIRPLQPGHFGQRFWTNQIFHTQCLVPVFSLYLLVRVCMACPWPRTVRSLRTVRPNKSQINIFGLNRTLGQID